MHDLLIVGGGAAGLAATAYGLDKQLDVRLIAERLGGKAGWQRHPADLHPLPHSAGEDVVRLLRERIALRPELMLLDRVTAVARADGAFHLETKRHGRVAARAIIIATGVTPIALAVPGSTQLLGYGLGYSAATHAQELRGMVVAAIGTTPRAMRGVHELSRIAAMVYWIGPSVKALMSPLGLGLQYRQNVEALEGFRVVEVIGAERIAAIVVERAGTLRRLDVASAFIDLGLQPNSAIVEPFVGLDADGFIQIADNGATALPGMYAAGDVTTAFGEQLLIAVGQGAHAATSAYDYLLSHDTARAA